jgi:hypothetical protein
MNIYSVKFDGDVLQRGFWLYVVDITADGARLLYVGRTGDSSSPNAASPFSRIGQHLDLRQNAKANALARNLRTSGVEPRNCKMEMIAFGPLFPEEKVFADHVPIRDRVASIEKALAEALLERGFKVIGKHHCKSTLQDSDKSVLADILETLGPRLRT